MVTRSFYAIAIAAVIVPGVCAEEPTIKPKDGLVLDSYALERIERIVGATPRAKILDGRLHRTREHRELHGAPQNRSRPNQPGASTSSWPRKKPSEQAMLRIISKAAAFLAHLILVKLIEP